MGLFKKKRKSATDQMANKELKENLADSALAVLVNSHHITCDDFAGIKAEFGYLLMIENHGLEALFKIIKDEDIYYFAAQQDNLMLVSINEEQFKSTVEYMLSRHL